MDTHKHLDVYLLRCFVALVTEAHVTRAAERMGTTQPAMSNTLGKLRILFGDPLLVRTEKGMMPTRRAIDIATSLRLAIDRIDDTLADLESFDPKSTTQFEIAASESVAFVLMSALTARLRELAPGVTLRVHIPDLSRMRQLLEEGQADLLLSTIRTAPEGLRSSPLLRQRLNVIASATHPDVRKKITQEQYLAWPHACHMIGRGGGSSIEISVDEALIKRDLARRVGVWLPSAVSSPAVVARTDFLATIPERVARHFAVPLGLQVLEPPIPLPDVQIMMYWHDRMHRNPSHRWLRQVLRVVSEGLQAEDSPSNG
jgi:DNA-binding transcriptional LysR family regulator